MNSEKLFETATRKKLRFPFKGMISVEDLWDLSIQNLDQVYKNLNSQIKQTKEESLLNTKSKEAEILETQIEIVKYMVLVKLAEKEAEEKLAAKKEQKQKIMSIIEAKREESLKNSSLEELQKMLDELGE